MGLPRSFLLACLLVGCSFPYEVTANPDGGTPGGSCADLPDGATITCGTCGRLPCVDGVYGACVEPEKKPGDTCGTCGKSSYVCRSPGVVECSMEEERTTGSDFSFAMPTSDVESRSVTRRSQLAVSYAAKHDGEITGVRLMVRRTTYTACGASGVNPHPDPVCGNCVADATTGTFNCTLVKPVTPGTVTMQIFRGLPDSMADAVPLATIEVDPMLLPETAATPESGTFYEFTAKTPVAVKTGDPLTIVLGIDSTSTAMIVSLARDRLAEPGTTTEHKTWTRAVYPPGTWIQQPRSHAFIDVKMRGCF